MENESANETELDRFRRTITEQQLKLNGLLNTDQKAEPNISEELRRAPSRESSPSQASRPPQPLNQRMPRPSPRNKARGRPRRSKPQIAASRGAPKGIRKRASTSRTSKPSIHRNELGARVTSDLEKMRQPRREEEVKEFIVGVDYGTTFTSVSYYSHRIGEKHHTAFPDEVKSIMNWPHCPMNGMNKQIPSESWYSNTPEPRQKIAEQFDSKDSDEEVSVSSSSRESSPSLSVNEPSFFPQNSKFQHASQIDSEESTAYLWGFAVRYQRYVAHTSRSEERLLRRPKLMLVRSEHTDQERQALRPLLDRLIQQGIIRKFGKRDTPSARDVGDVIADFLAHVLKHTMKQLERNENYTDKCPVSFVLTVPSVWCASSSRVLQFAMESAIKSSGFGSLHHGSVDNLFIVSEPEAAATFLLGGSNNMLPGDTFVVLDCGGGTVDAVTYSVTNGYPLRLNNEVVPPGGDNCGGSYLNINYENYLLDCLADEPYLDNEHNTRESIVKDLLPHFEDFHKRNQDLVDRPAHKVKIPGLRGDKREGRNGANAKSFEDNWLHINCNAYDKIFLPLLHRVGQVLRTQIETAISKGKEVRKVFLIGGFGAAPSLRSFLKTYLVQFCQETALPYRIELIESDEQTCVTAVASGAVLRAMNKDNGPKRFAHSSYGFLRKEHYDPDEFPGHRLGQPVRDQCDGEEYIEVIDYFMLKGELVPPAHKYEPMTCQHKFKIKEPFLICEEVLYVSDLATESSYPFEGHMNRGAQTAGKIVTDMTFLRDKGIILPSFPSPENYGIDGEDHYIVEYDLVPIVEGRNLRYEVLYPAGKAGKVMKTSQISIAAAFLPGTG